MGRTLLADLKRQQAQKRAHLNTETHRASSSEQSLEALELDIEQVQLEMESHKSELEEEEAQLRDASNQKGETEQQLEMLKIEVQELQESITQMGKDKLAQLQALQDQEQKKIALEAERAKREHSLEQAKEEHVQRKHQFTDNLLKLRADISEQKAAVAVQKQGHAAILLEKEQLRKELANVNHELKKLQKLSKDNDYAMNNDKYGLIQDRSNLQVAKDKRAEARDESQFERHSPNQRNAFDFNDDNDDLHANFDDLMPETPNRFPAEFGGNDFDNVNFDIPPGVDRTLFGDSDESYGYDSDEQLDVLDQIAGSHSNGAAQSPFGASADAWGAFDVPRDPSPGPRRRRAVPQLPIHEMALEASSPKPLQSSPDYSPFGESAGEARSPENEYEPFA